MIKTLKVIFLKMLADMKGIEISKPLITSEEKFVLLFFKNLL
jgi:hypothetical protein